MVRSLMSLVPQGLHHIDTLAYLLPIRACSPYSHICEYMWVVGCCFYIFQHYNHFLLTAVRVQQQRYLLMKTSNSFISVLFMHDYPLLLSVGSELSLMIRSFRSGNRPTASASVLIRSSWSLLEMLSAAMQSQEFLIRTWTLERKTSQTSLSHFQFLYFFPCIQHT